MFRNSEVIVYPLYSQLNAMKDSIYLKVNSIVIKQIPKK